MTKGRVGLTAMLGGALWLWLVVSMPSFETLQTRLGGWIVLPLHLLLLGVLGGLYVCCGSGRLGKAGLVVALVGASLMTVNMVLLASTGELFAGWFWFVGAQVFIGGWLLFGVAALKSKPLPRWNGLPLMIGLVPVLVSVLVDYLKAGE